MGLVMSKIDSAFFYLTIIWFLRFKKSFCFALLFALPNLAWAKEPPLLTPILRQIDQINTAGFPFNSSCGPVCLSPQDENALFQQCALDLCGPPNKAPKFIIDNTNFFKDIDPDIEHTFNQEIEPALRASINSKKDYYNNALSNIKKLRADLHADPESPEWDKILSQLVDRYTVDGSSTKHKTPIKKMRSEKKLDPIYPIIQAYVTEENKIRESTPEVLKQKDQNQLRTLLQNQYQSFLSEYQKNKHHFTPSEQIEIEVIESDISSSNIDTWLAQKIWGELNVFSSKIKRHFCSSSSCKKLITEELEFYQSVINSNVGTLDTNTDLEIDYCQSIFIETSQAIKQTKTYKESFKKYKEHIINTVFANYSSQSRQQFENYVNTMDFDMPHTNIIDYFKDHINQSTINNDAKEVVLHELDTAFNKKTDSCPPSKINSKITDAFSPFTNTIRVSFLSCAFHNHGKQVLAHELGHVASYLFNPKNAERTNTKMSELSYNKHKKLRECATNRYKQADPLRLRDHFSHENDSLRTEEDTADLISYISFQNNPVHTDCSLIKPSPDGSKYENLKVLYEPNHSDPHSTGFLRVLMEAIHKRTKLSPACQQVIDKYKDRVNFEPCF